MHFILYLSSNEFFKAFLNMFNDWILFVSNGISFHILGNEYEGRFFNLLFLIISTLKARDRSKLFSFVKWLLKEGGSLSFTYLYMKTAWFISTRSWNFNILYFANKGSEWAVILELEIYLTARFCIFWSRKSSEHEVFPQTIEPYSICDLNKEL